ncbi:MAG: IclR family transcriptional regulator [Treponema sp.]|jgi:DNA-binding IclR family transcriptional regulator|nr:IclR family transcriptional regulator [Treponema sp.]
MMIQSLNRGIDILFFLKQAGSASVTEVAGQLGVHKSTASRLMETLRGHDMIQLDPISKKYRLGYRLLFLADNIQKNTRKTMEKARPFMYALSTTVRESVHLGTFYNKRVYVVDQVRSNKEYRITATPGMVEPAHASALGKCIFAWRTPEFVAKYMADFGMPPFTENTITDINKFIMQLSQVRTKGYAIDDEELTPGIRCLASPIFDRRGEAGFSVGISFPATELSPDRIIKIANQLKNTCAEISRKIGYQKNNAGDF